MRTNAILFLTCCSVLFAGPLLTAPQAKNLATFGEHSHQVMTVAFSPDGKILASGSGQPGKAGEVKLWDVAARKEILTLREHTDFVTGVAFSPDGKTLASGGHDKTVRLWDVATRKQRYSLAHNDQVRLVAWQADGKILAAVGYQGELTLWDAATGKQAVAYPGAGSRGTAVAVAPDLKTVALGIGDFAIKGDVKLWDVRQRRSAPRSRGRPATSSAWPSRRTAKPLPREAPDTSRVKNIAPRLNYATSPRARFSPPFRGS